MKYKLSEKKYYQVIWVTIAVLILFFAFMDMQGYWMIDKVGGYPGETYAVMGPDYMSFFWSFASFIIIALATMFYFFRKDISESIAIFVGAQLMLFGGWEDAIYWVLQGGAVPLSWVYLYNTPIGWGVKLLGLQSVTLWSFLIQLVISLFLTHKLIGWLRKQKTLLGFKV